MPKFFLKWKKIYATRSLALASGLVTTTFIATPLTTGYTQPSQAFRVCLVLR
jgi:hypothetical protein